MPDRAAKTELFDHFAKVAGALASGRRAEIVDVLANGERTVDELSRQVGLSIANTSQHLQILKEAGLVASRREGTRIRYRLASPTVYQFWVALRSLTAERAPGVERLVSVYFGPRDELEPISKEALLARLHRGEPVLIVDVRPLQEYDSGHLPGARSIPLDELTRRLHELPRNRDIVAYCRGPYCAFAPEAVRTLKRNGFRARRLMDGLPEWAAAGYQVETTAISQ